MLTAAHYASLGLESIHAKVLAGERLNPEEGLALFNCPDLTAVLALAHHRRLDLHGTKTFYVRNRHINYSNVCVTRCRFCAFRREEGEEAAFTLTKEQILERAQDDSGLPFAEIHIVGGCHPTLRLEWFEDVFRSLKALRPNANIKAFTVVEINHFAEMEGISTREVLRRLKAAGLQMLTGGGAEIFNPTVRAKICPEKLPGTEYLRIAGEAHEEGLASNCSMLFGHVESFEDRIDHLVRLREQQDKSGGFMCFIPLAFQTANNPLARETFGEGAGAGSFSGGNISGGPDRLRTIAVSRLMLDNIPHIKAYWIMLGTKTAQLALTCGADDLDGTIREENIGRMAGAQAADSMTRAELETMIRGCGLTPVNRDALFTPTVEGSNGPAEATPRSAGFHALSRSALSLGVFAAKSARLSALCDRLANGYAARDFSSVRVNREEAERLYHECDLFSLGRLAHAARQALHPSPVVTYVGDRNINYSNVCVCACRFCAFFRPPGHPEGYVITRDELGRKIQETIDLGGTQILMQGGHHPDLPLAWYEELIRWISGEFPNVHVHSFSPPEIVFFAEKEGLSTDEVIARLKHAGLDSIPGGGAEILVNEVRKRVSPNKCSADTWLAVMRSAHLQGLKTTATMMFGHEEEDADRLAHLFNLRAVQDETHGFTAFIPWTFQPGNTQIHCPQETSQAYLRVLALSRLVLDNIPNLQASWVTMGPQVAQTALTFGANDFGSLMIEENVVAAAGTSFSMTREHIHAAVTRAGFIPKQRYMDYRLVE